MQPLEIISIIATFAGVACFSIVFTVLYQSYVHSTIAQVESGKRDIELLDATLNERSERTKKIKKILFIVRTTVFVLFLIIIIPLFMFALITRIAGDRPIFGKTIMIVASGSMGKKNEDNDYLLDLNDQIDKYDIIVLEKVGSIDDLKLYDIIAYKNKDGTNIIHRIVAINGGGDNAQLIMRGDANNVNDDYKPKLSDVIGVYRGRRIPLAGVIVMFLQSYSGIITVVALLYCLFMIDIVSRKIDRCETKRTNQLLSAIDSDEFSAKGMRAEFKETIYYRGYAYRFDETGFIDKTEITGDQPDDTMIKVYDGSEPQKILIETRKNDGKDK
ncbi:MAG: signal peptidase I [Clostridiales bacterium]|nr:signal peptidase I [Clostridiales bacterium]